MSTIKKRKNENLYDHKIDRSFVFFLKQKQQQQQQDF
jgi:hypothetical protein